jgi:hypothetical protein
MISKKSGLLDKTGVYPIFSSRGPACSVASAEWAILDLGRDVGGAPDMDIKLIKYKKIKLLLIFISTSITRPAFSSIHDAHPVFPPPAVLKSTASQPLQPNRALTD